MKGKIKESISLKIRKNFMANRAKTFLIIAILVVGFFTLNLWLDTKDLPKFDITENQVFTLSDASKNELKNVDQDVNIVVFGYDENSTVVDLLKQYNKSNSKIKYEIINGTDNPDKIKQYDLVDGYAVLIVEVGEMSTTLSSYDFSSYDYTTSKQIDLTENAITNAILNLTISEKPKVYILTGHNELSVEQDLTKILTYLQNEVFDYTTINLLTIENVPEDCDLIAVFSPQKDLMEQETNILKNYINNGGNIIFTSDLLSQENANMPNWQSILDLYGLTIENGIIYENQLGSHVQGSPLILFPQIENSDITSQIVTDGTIILEIPKRIKTVDEEKIAELNVSYEVLLKSSEESNFITDFSENALNSIAEQETESSIIAIKATKTIESETTENVEGDSANNDENTKTSEIIVISNGTFVSNYESAVQGGISQVDLYSNADFYLNSVANLTNRKDAITVRKETNSSIFIATEKENAIILLVIFAVPILIILIGIFVWNHRKHKR